MDLQWAMSNACRSRGSRSVAGAQRWVWGRAREETAGAGLEREAGAVSRERGAPVKEKA